MTDSLVDLFDDLEDLDHLNASVVKVDKRKKHTCHECGGTGKYRGPRVHQHRDHCFACKGKGYFMSSREDREKGRAARQDNKERKRREGLDLLEETNPGLVTFLAKAGEWSEFAGSLYEQVQTRGTLSEKQVAAAESMRIKCEARRKARAEKRAAQETAEPVYGELSRSFLSASEHLKWPKLRLVTENGQRVVLSRCGPNSRTPGHVNVTDGGPFGANTYFGRIDPEGRAFLRDTAKGDVEELLGRFDADPDGEIKEQGARTGNCCCCGRELTDPVSVANGIGPVCAGRWGF